MTLDTTQSQHKTDTDRFNKLTIYLGQLEYNLNNIRETLASMENEKRATIDELRSLELKIEEQPTD